MAVDAQSGNTYVFRYNDMPNGHYMLDQQEYLNDITLDLQNSMQAKIVKQEERNFFGYPGRYLLLDLSGTPIHGQLCTRDNRFYLQLAFESEVGKHQDDIHAFLNSFELLPFQPASWAPYSPPGAGFSISMPGEVMIEADSVSEYQMDFPLLRDRIYSASDTNSGMVYSLYIRQHAPYFTYEDEHTFYTRVEEFVQADEGDSLIFENSFHWMGVPVKEFVYQSPAYTYLKRVRVIPWGDKLYMLWAIVSRQAVNAGPTEDFFHSLQLDRTANSGQLFVAAKVAKERMMADILQADSSRRLLLNDYLRQYDGWTAADLPELHRMLEAISPQAPSAMQSTKKQLIRALGEVYDEGSTALLWKEYERYADTSHIRHSLLVALAQQHQADQWPTLLQRLYADQPEMAWEDKNDFFAPLKFDTTGMLASLLPHLMPLMERPHFARELYEVLEHALESHQLQPAHLQPYLPALSRELSLTADSLELAPLDTNDYAYLNRFYWQCELWQHLPLNAEATAALQRGQSGYAEFLHFSAIKALLKNGVTPDSTAFSTLAEDGYFRKELFELLDTLDQIQLLPQPYQNQQAMAQAYLEHAGYEYDEIEPDTMVFVEKRTIEINGHTGIIYLYKMGYFVEAEEAGKTVSINWYPGLSGLFPSDGGLRPLQNLCWPYWEKWEEMESSQAFIALWKEKMQQDDP
ncbi:MAG: hypothetical protein D6730_14440 [Bacteroidetes bacterium]|nr:MAG: hypothetical protein D6730_14440 [Bacteroidota bacterium]